MEKFKIAVIAGDGIGPEVIAEGKKVLSGIAALDGTFAVEFTDFPWGCEYYLKTGEMMPEDGLDTLKAFDAIYLGAVGYPGVPDNVSLGQLLLKIRRGFDEYVNLRPVKLLEGAPCPLAGVKREDIDMVVIRENSEGEYANVGARLYPGAAGNRASDGRLLAQGLRAHHALRLRTRAPRAQDADFHLEGQCARLLDGVLG